MSDRSPERLSRSEASRTAPRGWKLVQFLVLTVLVVGLGQVVETWLLPGPSADLAVAQLEASDSGAESLRLYETLRGFLPSVTALTILFIGLALFVPGYAAKVRRFVEEGESEVRSPQSVVGSQKSVGKERGS